MILFTLSISYFGLGFFKRPHTHDHSADLGFHHPTRLTCFLFVLLVWSYEEGKDSVLKVGKEDYEACNTQNPEQRFEDGNTKVELHKPGPFYFISGAKGHCQQGQKLVVVVVTPRRRFVSFSPAPSPTEIEGPAVAPSSGAASFNVGFLAAVVGILGLGVGFL